MTGLTTHVLDTMRGVGAAGMRLDVLGPDGRVAAAVLDEAGRAELVTGVVAPGVWEISFFAGDYLGTAAFYDVIPVRFLVEDVLAHYHVPLILSAFGYSTYRGG